MTPLYQNLMPQSWANIICNSFRKKVVEPLRARAASVVSADMKSIVSDCIDGAIHELDNAGNDPNAVCRANEFVALANVAIRRDEESAEPVEPVKHNRSWIDNTSNLWHVSIHEAAHCVLLMTQNKVPESVVVNGEDAHNVKGGRTRLVDAVNGEQRLMLLLAGGIGEELISNRDARWTASDERHIADELNRLGWRADDHRIDCMRDIVEQRLRRNHRVVNLLATELYKRSPQRMRSREILDLVDEVGGLKL